MSPTPWYSINFCHIKIKPNSQNKGKNVEQTYIPENQCHWKLPRVTNLGWLVEQLDSFDGTDPEKDKKSKSKSLVILPKNNETLKLDPHIPLIKLDQLMKTKLLVNLSKATYLWRKKSFTLNYPQAYFTREMIKKVPMKRPNNSVCGWTWLVISNRKYSS